MADLSIIIVSWNCWDDLCRCLHSIEQSGADSYQVIVVDNGSTDGTVSFLENGFPRVRLLKNKENLGFAAANNQALRIAHTTYVMLLNPDTIVKEGAIDSLLRHMDSSPEVWAAGPALVNEEGTPQRTGVMFPSTWNILVETFFLDRLLPHSKIFGRHRRLYENPAKPQAVDYVQGACLVVRHEAIATVGILDEQFFMYFEEADWCYRIKQKGGQVWYWPEAEVVHLGAGEGHFDERRLVFFHQSLFLFYRKYYSLTQTVAIRLVVIIRSFVRLGVWAGMLAIKPSFRMTARSCMRGYVRTIGLALQPVEQFSR